MAQEFYMWIVFGLTFLTMILYSLDKIRMEIISLFSIVVLLLIFKIVQFLVSPQEAQLILICYYKDSLIQH